MSYKIINGKIQKVEKGPGAKAVRKFRPHSVRVGNFTHTIGYDIGVKNPIDYFNKNSMASLNMFDTQSRKTTKVLVVDGDRYVVNEEGEE